MTKTDALFSLMILAIALKLGLLVILVISYGVVIMAVAPDLGRSGDPVILCGLVILVIRVDLDALVSCESFALIFS